MAILTKLNSDSEDLYKLTIGEDMTIYTVKLIKEKLCEEIGCYEKFEIDLTNVKEIDSAGIQLLLALKTELKIRKKILRLTSISNVVTELVKSYGLCNLFDIGDKA